MFSSDDVFPTGSGLEIISGEDLPCLTGDAGIMHRVDSGKL